MLLLTSPVRRLSLLLVLCAALVAASACSRSDSEAEESATQEQSAADEVPFFVGTWEIDISETLAPDELPEEERAVAAAMLESMSMTAIFEADGSGRIASDFMGEVGEEAFAWEVVEERADGSFRLSLQSPGEPDVDVVEVRSLPDGRFAIIEGEERLAFRRASEE